VHLPASLLLSIVVATQKLSKLLSIGQLREANIQHCLVVRSDVRVTYRTDRLIDSIAAVSVSYTALCSLCVVANMRRAIEVCVPLDRKACS